MAHRRGTPRGATAKRLTTWVAPADQGVVAVTGGTSAIIASFDPFASGLPRPTIVRTRGEVSIHLQSYGTDLAIGGAFGVCVVSADAFAAGAVSIPRPFDDADWGGWYVWRSFSNRLEVGDATGFIFPAALTFQVDSKAMRKVGANEVLVMMAESEGGSFSIAMHLRTLLKLS